MRLTVSFTFGSACRHKLRAVRFTAPAGRRRQSAGLPRPDEESV